MAKRFRGQGYQPPPQPKPYVPTRSVVKPPFYNEIDVVSKFPPEAPEWTTFMKEVVNMPDAMTPAVQEAIRQQRWKIAPDPLASIRTAAHQEAKKMGI